MRNALTSTAFIGATYPVRYAFDDIGNRESASERGTNTAYTANALNQYTNVEYSTVQPSTSNLQPLYDADGNETRVKTATGVWQITYNGENRPITWIRLESNNQTIENQTIVSMTYDRMGRRVTKGNQRSVYDVYLQIESLRSSTSTSPFNSFYEYAPFGAVTAQRGESAVANPWRFSSEYAEDETGTV